MSMNKKFASYNNEKLSKIIQLSANYKNHRKLIQNIRPSLGIPSIKQIQKLDILTQNRIKYAQQSRNHRYNQLRKQNQGFVKRLQKTDSVYKNIYNPQLSRNTSKTLLNNSKLSKSKSKDRLQSRQSLKSSSSQTSVLSNLRSRKRKYNQIVQQNKIIAERITNPKVNKNMRIKQLNKSYAKQQQFMRIRSRFSQRSKSIMQSLTLDGLKMQKKYLQFLPQINQSKSKNYQTINSSRNSLLQEDQNKKKHKTINIADHIKTARNHHQQLQKN